MGRSRNELERNNTTYYENAKDPILLLSDPSVYEEILQTTWSHTSSILIHPLKMIGNCEFATINSIAQKRIPQRLHVVFAVSKHETNLEDILKKNILSLQKTLAHKCEQISFYCIVVSCDDSVTTEEIRELFTALQSITEMNNVFYIGNYYNDRTVIEKEEKMKYLQEICHAVESTLEASKTIDVLGFNQLKINMDKFYYVSLNGFIQQLEKKIPNHQYEKRNKACIQKIVNHVENRVSQKLSNQVFNIPHFVTGEANIYHYTDLEEAERLLFGDEMQKLANLIVELDPKIKEQTYSDIEQMLKQIWIDGFISNDVTDRLEEQTATELLEEEIDRITSRICLIDQNLKEEYHSNNFAAEYHLKRKRWLSDRNSNERDYIQDYLLVHIYQPLRERERLQSIADILAHARTNVRTYELGCNQLFHEWDVIRTNIDRRSKDYITEGTDYMNEFMSIAIDNLVAKCMHGRTFLDKEICITDGDDLFEDILLKEFNEKVWKRINYMFESPNRLVQLPKFVDDENKKKYFSQLWQAESNHIRVPAVNIGTDRVKCEDERYYFTGQTEDGITTEIIKQCKGIDIRNLL